MLAALDCDVSVIDAAALARTAPGGGPREPTEDGWDAADAISRMGGLRRCGARPSYRARPFEAAKARRLTFRSASSRWTPTVCIPKSSAAGATIRIREIVRVSAPFEILGLGRNPEGKSLGTFSALARSRRPRT